ncbi:MAG TPA: hypothetical protein VMA77_29310 [Solirubrobacteraceae bacterium]|nr:hypothetical protein [Solirubrobacteraceae bacterium]
MKRSRSRLRRQCRGAARHRAGNAEEPLATTPAMKRSARDHAGDEEEPLATAPAMRNYD